MFVLPSIMQDLPGIRIPEVEWTARKTMKQTHFDCVMHLKDKMETTSCSNSRLHFAKIAND